MVLLIKPAFLLALLASGPAVSAIDLDGRLIQPLTTADTTAVVLFFAATDCPVSNRYVPEILRLKNKFAAEHVKVWFVYPNPADTAEIVRKQTKQFAIEGNIALDTAQSLVHLSRATITPEAAIFVPTPQGLHEVYRGRIDDRYLSFGQERPHALHHDLEDAIHAVLAHQTVPPPGGRPVGCAIQPLHP
jgi:hypothetical protein